MGPEVSGVDLMTPSSDFAMHLEATVIRASHSLRSGEALPW